MGAARVVLACCAWLAIASSASKADQSKPNHFLAAALARAAAILVMFPLDTLKTRAQCSSPPPLRLSGIYKGVLGSLLGAVPSAAIIFGCYECAKAALARAGFGAARAAFAGAVVGDALGALWLVPSEVLKQRLQSGVHDSLPEAFAEIWRRDGLLGFYAGVAGQLARDVPFRCIQMTTYEVAKQAWGGVALESTEAALLGAAVGTLTAVLTTPMDLVKTRAMVDGAGLSDVVSDVLGRDGPSGFLRGAGHRALYVGPSTGIFFLVYEAAGRLLAANDVGPDL